MCTQQPYRGQCQRYLETVLRRGLNIPRTMSAVQLEFFFKSQPSIFSSNEQEAVFCARNRAPIKKTFVLRKGKYMFTRKREIYLSFNNHKQEKTINKQNSF